MTSAGHQYGCTTAVQAYGGQAGNALCTPLPYTGINLFVFVCFAIILVGSGVIMREAGRKKK